MLSSKASKQAYNYFEPCIIVEVELNKTRTKLS